MNVQSIKSVAVVGAGAAGAIAAAALANENTFEKIRVFERRETPGGTWIYDSDPVAPIPLQPGKLPPEIDPPLEIPKELPQTTIPCSQYRYDKTPIYAELTSNVPDIAMSFSDRPFPYGPFVPSWVPKQYIENYFSWHRVDHCLVLNTTVEDISRTATTSNHQGKWKLTLRRCDRARHLDIWWDEDFDAVILANGHYSIPYIPAVKGLDEYIAICPSRVSHSKFYRTVELYSDKRVLVVGNSASGHDITTQLVHSADVKLPVYQSRRSRSPWDGTEPPAGVKWKPEIEEYTSTGEIIFADKTRLVDIDAIIYCTGYKPSFPFWNVAVNGGPLYDYTAERLMNFYQHTFSRVFPHSLGIVGLPRVLTFRSFEYQAIALARLFAGRNAMPLPSPSEQEKWEKDRAELVSKQKRKFHDIPWDNGETMDWMRFLFEVSGLPILEGSGRYPPVLGKETRWAIEHIRKYPEPDGEAGKEDIDEEEWAMVELVQQTRDSLHFV